MRRVSLRSCADAASLAAAALLACSPSSPQTQVKEALARQGPLRVAVPGAEADLAAVRFSDVVVSMDGARALVVAMAEADGRTRAGGDDASLAYVGREAFAMRRCAGAGWCPEGVPLPGLGAVLAALPALRARSAAGAGGPIRSVAWQVRVERNQAVVGEDFEAATGAGAPVRRRSVHELVREGSGWKPATAGRRGRGRGRAGGGRSRGRA